MNVWHLHMDFQTVEDTIAYAKNLVLKHLTDQGRADSVEHVEWWIKGDSTYYCPMCMNALTHEVNPENGPSTQEVHCLRCDQCQAKVSIPANAFDPVPQ